MRVPAFLLAVFILPATLAPAWAQGQPFPYDPYPWCAVYSGRGGERNQFYNPRGGSDRSHKQQPR
jgi:hypothetical protein